MMTQLLKISGMIVCFALAVNCWAENLLKNTEFSKDSGWYYTYVHPQLKEAGGSADFQEGKAVMVIVPMEKSAPHFIQLKSKVDLEVGKTYKMKLKISSDGNGQIAFNYCHGGSLYAWIIFNIKPGEDVQETTFTVKPDKNGKFESPREMAFFCGKFNKANLILSEISLEEVKSAVPTENVK